MMPNLDNKLEPRVPTDENLTPEMMVRAHLGHVPGSVTHRWFNFKLKQLANKYTVYNSRSNKMRMIVFEKV